MPDYNVTFTRHVKFNKDRYKTGESLIVSEDEYTELLKVGVISEAEAIAKPEAPAKKKTGK